MTPYFLSQRQRVFFDSWRRLYFLRTALRDRLQVLEENVLRIRSQRRHANLSEALKIWKVVVFHAPTLDLQTLGFEAFHVWRSALRALKFKKRWLLRKTFAAWTIRIHNLGKMRSRVLNIRKACSLLETRYCHCCSSKTHVLKRVNTLIFTGNYRLRNKVLASLALRFNRWAGKHGSHADRRVVGTRVILPHHIHHSIYCSLLCMLFMLISCYADWKLQISASKPLYGRRQTHHVPPPKTVRKIKRGDVISFPG